MITEVLELFNHTSQGFVFVLFIALLCISSWGYMRGYPFLYQVFLSVLGVFFYGWLSCCEVPQEWRYFLGRTIIMASVVCIGGELLVKIYYKIR